MLNGSGDERLPPTHASHESPPCDVIMVCSENVLDNPTMSVSLSPDFASVPLVLPQASKPPPRFKRTRIEQKQKRELEDHFQKDAYPNDNALAALERVTLLKARTIKTWFANARVRKAKKLDHAVLSIEMPISDAMVSPDHADSDTIQTCVQAVVEITDDQHTRSQATRLTPENLRTIDKASPPAKGVSVERYLSSSISEGSLNHGYDFWKPTAVTFDPTECSYIPTYPGNSDPALDSTTWPAGASSAVGSDQSGSSFEVDFRGARRGRRGWQSGGKDVFFEYFGETLASASNQRQAAAPKPKRYYCTWPTCSSVFQHRYEWARHEEAVHYYPIRWICCATVEQTTVLKDCFICGETSNLMSHLNSTHFFPCAKKAEKERTYYRQDQFAQHVKRGHGMQLLCDIPDDFFAACQSANPEFNPAFLRCGFCGLDCRSWKHRQNHVFSHIQHGDKKDCWWQERLHNPGYLPIRTWRNGSVCWNCDKPTKNHRPASECSSWSCRYLKKPERVLGCCRAKPCRLCSRSDFNTPHSDSKHLKQHKLRSCRQEVFRDMTAFLRHLQAEHNMRGYRGPVRLLRSLLKPWECVLVYPQWPDK